MKKWQQIWKPPFRKDKYSDWVLDRDDRFVFQFEQVRPEEEVKILNLINGIKEEPFEEALSYRDTLVRDEQGRDLIMLRGWGYLTGIGGLNLPFEEASNIQDTFGAFILSKLNPEKGNV